MSLKKKTISGLIWSFGAQGGKQVSQFIITAILARLLSPNDFGVLGMATVFTGFVAVFGELGVSGALIQKQDVDDDHLSSAFWLNIAVGIMLTLIFMASASLIANFYNKPELKPILTVLSFNFVFSSFTVIQQTILTKEMNFKALAVRDVTAVIISGIVGIFLAYNGLGVWSLVYQTLTFTFVNGFLLWILSKWRPKFVFSISAIKDIFHFSANLTGTGISGYFARNIDYLLIGKFLGAESLGYYTLAYKLMLVPLQNVTNVISKVMFPAFSKIQNDLEKVKNTYLKMIKAISLITFPLMFGLFAVAPEFVNVVYGAKWEPVIVLIRIFCFCGMIQSIYITIGPLILSQGRSDLLLRLSILGTFFAATAITIGLKWGIRGVAFMYSVEQMFWIMYSQYVANSLVKIEPKIFIASFLKSFVMSLIMFLSIGIFKMFICNNNLISLLLYVFGGMSVYLFLLFKIEKFKIESVSS